MMAALTEFHKTLRKNYTFAVMNAPGRAQVMDSASKKTDKATDAQLLASYLDTGRLDYFGELYNRYLPLVYGLCLKYLGDSAEAEDAVMQIFEDIVPKIRRSEIREFRTWIYTVARNYCFQQLRRKKPRTPLDLAPPVMESDDFLHLLDKRDNEALLAVLEKCMEQLPEPQRRSITLFFFDEKSYAEIVELTDYHLKSVKSYIQNGKRNLRICIETQGDR